jgi:TetR/AcrR family fatty acid metabolism transcriptional regulator
MNPTQSTEPTTGSAGTPVSARERLLDAALQIFSRQGYHETRLEDIISQAETSKGALYLHFPNKERLFMALVDRFAALLERRVRAAIQEEARGMARVRIALQTCLETFGQYRRPAKILLVQASGLGAVFENKRNEVNERFAQLIAGYLAEAVDLGEIAPVDIEVVSHAWMGAIYGVVIHWVYTGDPDPPRIMETLLPLLLRSVGFADEEQAATA